MTLTVLTALQDKVKRLALEKQDAINRHVHTNAIVEKHLLWLTIDEWRALNEHYMKRKLTAKLAHTAKTMMLNAGLGLPKKQHRLYEDANGNIHDTALNIYPKHILDEAAKTLGVKVRMKFQILPAVEE
jgi:hypothetical protein